MCERKIPEPAGCQTQWYPYIPELPESQWKTQAMLWSTGGMGAYQSAWTQNSRAGDGSQIFHQRNAIT